ncbi:MAG TPA: hypothetical protein VGZ02_01780 [Candidatus Baltobacteraceae bacterium]|nr:hypothetical protein [Candidatus Baltobacteraceae bacterium]
MLTTLAVTCAATLFEGTPFILAAAALARAPLRRSAWVVPYLGCGCAAGPSARSLPAAAAAFALFGPAVAVARVVAAAAMERLRPRVQPCTGSFESPLHDLALLVPCGCAAAAIAAFGSAIIGSRPPAFAAFAAAGVAAFAAAPCGLGTVAIAAALRTTVPAAAAAILCIAGIADLRVWLPAHRNPTRRHDALAYTLAALACANVCARHGTGLVHPAIAVSLGLCGVAFLAMALRYRSESAWPLRIAPAIMLIGSVLSAPPPQYHATETTLSDAFAGEHVDFTGELVRTGAQAALVRYAITCCRADAAPIALRLLKAPRETTGWMHARGDLVQTNRGLALRGTLERISAPADPFAYR